MNFSQKSITILGILILILSINQPVWADLVHRVTENETLDLISQMYRQDVAEIMKKNNLQESVVLVPRQVLIIPKLTKNDIYRVSDGDSIIAISEKIGVALDLLLAENNLTDGSILNSGQVLFIPKVIEPPKPKRFTYTVQSGDSLITISKKLEIAMDALVQENAIKDINYIYSGQVLKLPEGAKLPPSMKPKPNLKPNPVPQLLKDFPNTFLFRGSLEVNRIALTFDDGPDNSFTPQILDILKDEKIKATFFLLGKYAELYPEVVQRIVDEGHIIANHSYAHPNLTNLDDSEIFDEIKNSELVLKEITGLQTLLLRPPYGEVSQKLLEQVKELGYVAVTWSVDSVDWRSEDVDQILINTLPDVKNGGVILFHSAGGKSLANTVQVLPELIFTLRVLGYEFVTLDELLNVPAYL